MQGTDFLGTYIKTKLNIKMKVFEEIFYLIVSTSEYGHFLEFLHTDCEHMRFAFVVECPLPRFQCTHLDFPIV